MSISIPRWQIGSLCRLKRESKFQVSGHELGCSKVVNHLGDEVQLEQIVDGFDSPELIDDGPGIAPSKRIIDHLPRYESDKSTVGIQAAERIGLARIRRRCPHFGKWIDRLQKLSA